MQCGAVVSGGVLEGVLRRQVDVVLRAAVEGAIRLVVGDVRAAEFCRICSPAWTASKVVCCLGVCGGIRSICWALNTVYTRWMSRDFSSSAPLPLAVLPSPAPSGWDGCVLSEAD